LLIGPTSAFGLALGLDDLAGPVVVGIAGFGLAGILMAVALRPDPLDLAIADHPDVSDIARPLRELLASKMVQLSISAIVLSQAVMVLVMVMTPIHIRNNDGTLATVGWVMMAHTLGMFAVAPVTGLLVGRFGPVRMIGASIAVFVVACVMAALATTASTPLLIVGLFLLGVAWNFGFVAGSTLLQADSSVPDRLRLQGFADSSAWVTSAGAAAVSGVVVAGSSYGTLALGGAVAILVLMLPVYRSRTAW
jgi:MFS family permease